MSELKTDILIVGGGIGGCAAAIAATAMGKHVILTEPTDWLGGQLSSQAVPPDENPWIGHGATRRYAQFREGVKDYYRRFHPLMGHAYRDTELNPGGGYVSRLCHEPGVAAAVLEHMLAPARTAGRLRTFMEHEPIAADADGDRVRSVTLRNLRSGGQITVSAPYILDATELGDLLPLAGVEYVSGAESRRETGEPHAVDGESEPDNVQAITWCFPLGYDPAPGADHTIEKPAQYEHWRQYVPKLDPPWPGQFLSWVDVDPQTCLPRQTVLFPHECDKVTDPSGVKVMPRWTYRRIVDAAKYEDGAVPHDVTLVNWPQNDYFEGNLIDKPKEEVERCLKESMQLSLSLIYWMQTEAPNYTTDGQGYPGLYLCPHLSGTDHGLAKMPYIRESRRIRALFTVTENHVGTEARCGRNPTTFERRQPGFFDMDWPDAERFEDSVGLGAYRIDLHMSTGGNNYIDISSLPFQIPLGALIPQRVENLLPACKNIGTTHITNGCYRLHPVEWNIGEAVGALAAYCLDEGVHPAAVRENSEHLRAFQDLLVKAGIPLRWNNTHPI